jgi:hypothetical protein
MPRPPEIWIVDAAHWPRAYLRAELIERGYDAIGFATLADALGRLLLPEPRPPALLVLDLRGQVRVEARLAGALQLGIPILAVADAIHGSDENLPGAKWAGFLRRPLTIGDIADRVDRLLGAPSSTGRRRL